MMSLLIVNHFLHFQNEASGGDREDAFELGLQTQTVGIEIYSEKIRLR